ncbi:hypothetical protein B566_EDAN011570 [Ephemera danica]|nr:hypothetical protein B566_EDAN011570 [Ephemera danica]
MSRGSEGTSCGGAMSGEQPKPLSYEGLNPTLRELLQQRPLEPHRSEVSKILKPVMQNFLKNNNYNFKASDNKGILVGYILDMVAKSQPKQSCGVCGESSSSSVQVPGVPEELVRGLPVDSVTLLRTMSARSRKDLECYLLDFGGVVSDDMSQAQLLCQLAELLSEQNRAEQGMDARQHAAGNFSTKRQYTRPECCVCMEEFVSAGFNPCGHAITCMECAKKLEQCPMCRQNIVSVLHLYFA